MNANDIYYGIGGVDIMSKAMEELGELYKKDGEEAKAKEVAIKLLRDGLYPPNRIAEIAGLSFDELDKLQAEQQIRSI